MNPSPAAIAAIQSQVTDWTTETNASITARLNAPAIANPTPQGTVAGPITATDVMGLVGSESLAKINALPQFSEQILPLLNLPDPKPAESIETLTLWAQDLLKAGDLVQAEFDALAAPAPGSTPGAPTGVFNQTQPDPSYQAQISWAQNTLGRPLDAADVAASRP